MLFGFLKSSKAYLQDKRVLIDGSPLFLSFMRANKDSFARVKKLIEQVAGESYAIGPYEKKAGAVGPTQAEKTLQMLRDGGVPVQID
jgi:DNA polymerase-3 subunit gamma/tau